MTAPFELTTLVAAGAIGLVVIGAIGLVASNNLFRMLLALVLAEAGVNLFIVLAGYKGGAIAPILGYGDGPMVDPIPQVLVLTAIVIGVGVQALAVSALVRIYRAYGTLDMPELRWKMELDISAAAGVEPPRSFEQPRGGRPISPVPHVAVIRTEESKR